MRFSPIGGLGERNLIGRVSPWWPSQGWRLGLGMSGLQRSFPTQREADKVLQESHESSQLSLCRLKGNHPESHGKSRDSEFSEGSRLQS